MANLAIKGHINRGKEVIELLQMLGGNNVDAYLGRDKEGYYFINEYGDIDWFHKETTESNVDYFTLEEFIEKYPYKVGDKVKIKETGKDVTIEGMSWRNGCEVIYDTCYKNDCVAFYSAEELQPYKEETMESKPNLLQQLKDYFDNTPREVLEKEWNEYDRYNEIGPTVNEYLEYVNKSRQSQYPKTYEECDEIISEFTGSDCNPKGCMGYRSSLLTSFYKLIVCRDAYWKIAGDEMGLDEPWKSSKSDSVYCIFRYKGDIVKDNFVFGDSIVLEFPTEEMRDAFLENFRHLIELCKELL